MRAPPTAAGRAAPAEANAGGRTPAGALYAQGGAAVFWDGITPKLLRAVVNHAVTFAVFEKICALYVLAT